MPAQYAPHPARLSLVRAEKAKHALYARDQNSRRKLKFSFYINSNIFFAKSLPCKRDFSIKEYSQRP